MTRLDVYLAASGFAQSRQKAKNLIEAGEVTVDGRICTKPSFAIDEAQKPHIEVRSDTVHFVGRGGYKLQGALDAFGVDVTGMTVADIGASTGGFTQCLLMHGAKKVFAVDAGKGQLHPSLRADSRVVCMEETNARELQPTDLGERCDLCVMDVSFISQMLLYPAVLRILREDGLFISLVKPQFEAGKQKVGKGGLVRDPKVHIRILTDVVACAAGYGLYCRDLIRSPIDGGDGNREYLALFSRTEVQTVTDLQIRQTVNRPNP